METWCPLDLSTEETLKQRDKLPDCNFAFPRLRKEPLTNANLAIRALTLIKQVGFATDEERDEAFSRIKQAADYFGVQIHVKTWRDVGIK